ncbi:MAG: hypothetical protein OQL06_05450 [Gammaproteobacteria bacterium]|nr:hypothetical protein [Gammaproteobacteria bacterium]
MKNKLKQISRGQNILFSGLQLGVIALLVFILVFLVGQLDGAELAVIAVSLLLAYTILQYSHISNRRKKIEC